MENGIYKNLPAESYFAEDRINCSGLKLIARTPAHYKYYKQHLNEKLPTPSMVLGTAVHCAVLEPDTFKDRYAVAPQCDKRTKEGKAIWAELEAHNKIILSASDYEAVEGMSQSVLSHETASKLLEKGDPEVSIFTDIEGIPAKARLDWYRNGIILDLKTTQAADPDSFSKSCANFGYALQCALYLDLCAAIGLEAHTFIFIVVESSAPFLCTAYELDDLSIEWGRDHYKSALNKFRECMALDDWPGFPQEITTISLPSWTLRNLI
jgi:exodeoxyribonuclease VIII